jgi:preprotein translocase subunit SecF
MRSLIILITILIMIFACNPNLLLDHKGRTEVSMASNPESKQVVDLEEFLTSQAVRQEALVRLLVKKGVFSRKEFSEMVRAVNQEMKPIGVRLPVPPEGR